MLDGLVQTIEKLRARIREHRATIGDYEARTRASLIDPLLCALGWEVGDPVQVMVEKVVGEGGQLGDTKGRPDYALLGAMRKPVLFIEAKRLGVAREPIEQVVGYVTTENIRSDYKVSFCAWTNGDVWKVFDISKQKVVVDVQVSRHEPANCAFQLLGLWRPSLVDGSLRSPVNLITKEQTEPSAHDDHGVSEPRESAGAGTLASFDASWMPLTIAFPGEPAQRLGKQKDLITAVANYLARVGLLTTDNGVLKSGPKAYIVNSEPKHPTGKAFRAQVKLENGLYLETHNSFAGSVRYALRLLEHYGDPGLAARVRLGR